MIQKVKTILIPESGLELEPRDVVEAEVSTDFTRTFAHLVGKGAGSGILLRCTSDGRLLVATTGIAYETYETEEGTALDAFDALHTYDQTEAQYVTDILVETHPAIVAFRDVNGAYGDEKRVTVGFTSIDLIHYGMRIRNRTPGSDAVYEFTIYR